VSKLRKTALKSKWPKSDARHWQGRVFRNSYTRDGERHETADWCVKLGHEGRRETFNLGTPNAEAAALRALKIYRVVIGAGWTAAIAEFKPDANPADAVLDATRTTVGQLIEASARLSPARWESLETYGQALRRIAAAVNKWDGTNKFSPEGSKAWRAKVDSITLASITPAAVEEWRKATLKAAKTPAARNAAVVTTNSLIRNSRALVSRKIKDKLTELIQLPEKLWFHGISMETPPPLRYKSKIDAIEILKSGIAELATSEPEVLKCLFLTLVCGLRRSEADTLLWEQIDFKKGTIELMDTVHKRLKSEASAGEIAMDPEVVAMFKKWNEAKRGPFVLESALKPRGREKKMQFRRYRANPTHLRLLAWLRAKGVPSHHPIHLMRKEVGSVIATRDGIFAASRFLRHSDIAITAKLYADLKEPVSSGFGAMLAPNDSNVVAVQFNKPARSTAKAKKKQAGA
jgi:integrase